MGLDSVELVIRMEQEFGIEIPDSDAEKIVSPRTLADYVSAHITLSPTPVCLTRRAFYRIRSALQQQGFARGELRPSTSFGDLYPEHVREDRWKELGTRVAGRRWPTLHRPLFRRRRPIFPRGCETLGGLARHVATWDGEVPSGADAVWTEETVLLRVRQITEEELGIDAFGDTDRYVEDLGVD
jgi:hypothetical protein